MRLCARPCALWFSLPLRRLHPSVSAPHQNQHFRLFHTSRSVMSDLQLSLTAPNGRQYTQPVGLFINNQFVPSKSGEKFATINPAYVGHHVSYPVVSIHMRLGQLTETGMSLKSPLSMRPARRISILPSRLPERPSRIPRGRLCPGRTGVD